MPGESKKAKKERTAKIIRKLKKTYPDAKTELNHTTPLELLVATILSAQNTDKQVNAVTEGLFRKYRKPRDYAAASLEQFRRDITGIGLWRNKSKNIIAAATMIVNDFGGEVPDTMDDLLKLPGVARKTANVVLGNAFGKNEGIVVDTHVQRLAERLKLTARKNNQGDKMEKELMDLVPRKEWCLFAHLLIFHGRRCCTARKPRCADCPVSDLCPSAFKV
jgi:endonuclease-3